MNNFQQIKQIGNFIKGIKNPKQAAIDLLGDNMNPMAQNVLKMVQDGQFNDIETFAKNVCKEQGKDFDKEFKAFKDMLGL